MGTIQFDTPTSSTSMEKVSKPTVRSVLILERAPSQAPDQLQEAEIRWGQASQFDISATNPRDTTDGTDLRVVVRQPADEPPEEVPVDLLLDFVEIRQLRKTHDIVITADGGGDASITVQRIDKISFLAPQEFVQMFAKATGVAYSNIVLQLSITWNDGE